MLSKILSWTARILNIALIAFFLLFSFDSFAEGFSLMILLGFLIHNIPTFLIAGSLWLAWKRPVVGGTIFIALGLFCFFFFNSSAWPFTVGPTFLIGALYIASHYTKRL